MSLFHKSKTLLKIRVIKHIFYKRIGKYNSITSYQHKGNKQLGTVAIRYGHYQLLNYVIDFFNKFHRFSMNIFFLYYYCETP